LDASANLCKVCKDLETASRNPKDIQNALFYYNPPLKTHYSPQKQTPFLFNKKGLAVAKPIFNFQLSIFNLTTIINTPTAHICSTFVGKTVHFSVAIYR